MYSSRLCLGIVWSLCVIGRIQQVIGNLEIIPKVVLS